MGFTTFSHLRWLLVLGALSWNSFQAVALAEDVSPPGEDALQRTTSKLTSPAPATNADKTKPEAAEVKKEPSGVKSVLKSLDPQFGSAIPTDLDEPALPDKAAKIDAAGSGNATPVSAGQTTADSDKSIQPVPDPAGSDVVEIEAASFNGITPGVSTLQDVRKNWGAAKDSVRREGQTIQLYSVKPFDQVEMASADNKVTSIVIRLANAYPATTVAEQLQLSNVRPVLVSNALGEILGQSYPERGVAFNFLPNDPPNKPSYKVNQIILEPVSAEPFLLRAETFLDTHLEASVKDLAAAIKLDPNNGRAYWLQARALSSLGDTTGALSSINEAVSRESDNPQYHLTRAQVLGQQGQFSTAIQEAEKSLATCEKRPHIKARTLCLLGDLYGSGLEPDYKQAMTYHTEALKTADPLTTSPHPAIRVTAKEVVVDAHLGAAHDVAWGVWNKKQEAVTRWLEKASALNDDLLEKESVSPERRFRVGIRALAALVGVQGGIDPTHWAQQLVESADQLLGSVPEAGRKQQLQWELGMALYDAVQIYQMRGEHDQALKYGQRAIAYLEQGATQKQDNVADNYLLGRLYFRLGAIYAVGKQNHQSAVTWFEKAIPVFDRLTSDINSSEYGRLGETYVSMGVSYWETGQRQRATELSQKGIGLIEKMVANGGADASALEIPYSNLATMRRQMGQTAEAEAILKRIGKNKKPTTLR